MGYGETDSFKEYLNKIKDIKDDKCWFCNKTPDQLREDFFESRKDPSKGFDQFELDDIIMITYKTKQPICASCYFTLRQHPDLIKEILVRPPEEIW